MTTYREELENEDGGSTRADLAEQARRVAANPDLIVRAETGARLREEKAESQRRRIRRRVLGWSIGAVGLFVLIAVGLYFAGRPGTTSESLPPSLPTGAVLESETVSQTHVIRKLIVHLGEHGSFPVQVLVFDQNRFLRNDTILSNPRVLENALASSRERLLGSWIVIFAAASMEGEPDENLNLCRKRVAAVAAWLRAVLGPRNSNYWGLPVGEYRMVQAGRQLDEAAEDARAAEIGQEQLAKQRQLMIVSIHPSDRVVQPPDHVIGAVIMKLREAQFIPLDYDFGTSVPAPLPAVITP